VLGLLLASPSRAASPAVARPYDPQHPVFVEFSVGGVDQGPDGTDFGAGQDYGFSLGFRWRPHADVSAVIGWVNARETSSAIETDITSAGVRGRAWVGMGRWSGYGSAGARLYRVHVAIPATEDSEVDAGGELGAGLQYSRSTWWLGLGASLHAVIESSDLEGGNLFTYTSYQVSVGFPTGW
jgi:hypothetical protein